MRHVFRVCDDSQRIRDVAIRSGKIVAVNVDILPSSAREVVDVTGKIVLPGLIDTHAHVYQYVSGRFGMNPDMVGVQSGVTTLVDQGGPSCMTLPGFRHFIAEPAQSRVYAFLSAYLVGGLGVNYQRADGIVLAPVRAGLGLRLGASLGYLAYSRQRNVIPL